MRTSAVGSIFRLRDRLIFIVVRGTGVTAVTPSGGNGTCRKEDDRPVMPPRVATCSVAEGSPIFRNAGLVAARGFGRAFSMRRSTGRGPFISSGTTRMGPVRPVSRLAPGRIEVLRIAETSGSFRRARGTRPDI